MRMIACWDLTTTRIQTAVLSKAQRNRLKLHGSCRLCACKSRRRGVATAIVRWFTHVRTPCSDVPPSTIKPQPVTKLDLGLHKKITASATSSGHAIRPKDTIFLTLSSNPGPCSTVRCTMGVFTHDGHTQLTRIPFGALSSAT